jgi:trigger factor
MEAKLLKIENGENCIKKMEIEIADTDIQTKSVELFERLTKSASLPGFRAGHVPRPMLEARYKAQIRSQAIEDLLPLAYDQIVKEQNLFTLSEPYITDIKAEPDSPVVFTLEVEVRPEVKLGSYENLTLKKNPAVVTDEEVDNVIKRLQDDHASFSVITDRAIQEGDQVAIEFTEKINDIKVAKNKTNIEIGKKQIFPEIEAALIGKSTGDFVPVNFKYADDFGDPKKAGKVTFFSVKVKEIRSKNIPALDDEFAKDLGQFDTLQQLKDKIKADLSAYKDEQEKENLENQVITALVENIEMDLPASQVQKSAQQIFYDTNMRLRMHGMPADQLQQNSEAMAQQSLESAKRMIKSAYAINEISQKENIQVTDEEVEKSIEELAAKEQVDTKTYKDYLIQHKQISSVRNNLVHDKVIALIISKAKIEDAS